MTRGATKFVGATTFSALASEPVQTSLFDERDPIPHTRLGQMADLIVVCPATARLIGDYAAGISHDLLTATLLATRAPVLLCPAMHTEMWEHPATRANVATLRARGIVVLDPAVGRLTGADTGPGRLPDPDAIAQVCFAVLAGQPRDLAGCRVVVSAGGTQEPLDPVRFLGNRSSGKQGYALASAAAARGAAVVVVAANVALDDPAGCTIVRVSTAEELRVVMLAQAVGADVVVMAAAVADFRPAQSAAHKIKKDDSGSVPVIELERTADVLAELVQVRAASASNAAQLIVGFAAETGDESNSVIDHGWVKLRRKGCDLLVVNDVSEGRAFGTDTNEVTILTRTGATIEVPPGSKSEISSAIWDAVSAVLATP